MGSIFKPIKKLFGGGGTTIINATPTAQPAASVAAPDSKQETGVDTAGEALKRKAKGKRGLMISPSNTSAGGSTGGTGLNI